MDRREGPEVGAAAWDSTMGKGGGKSLLAWAAAAQSNPWPRHTVVN